MRLAVVMMMVVAACSHHGDAPRTRDELVKQVGDYADQIKRGGPPQPGDLRDVPPPSDQELRWINDSSDHDAAGHQVLGIRLTQQCRDIGAAYARQHRPEAAAWLVAGIDVFAAMFDALAGEAASSADPPSATEARSSLGELANIFIETAELQLRNYYSLSLPAYVELVDGWRTRAAKLRRIWTQAECDKVGGMLAIKALGETDGPAKNALQDLEAQLHDCKGEGR